MSDELKKQERQESTKKQQKVGPPSGLGKKGKLGNLSGKKKESNVMVITAGEDGPKTTNKKMFIDSMGNVEFRAKGGRAGFKMGSKCKLATKGKGRAYGKNS